MIKNTTVTLVIPCKNEADSLPRLLAHVPKIVDEVIIVDNNSSDNTAVVAKKLGARVIHEKRIDNRGIGYGYAHQAGIQHAKGKIIVTMDGDGTYPMEEISRAVKYLLKNDLDFISCTRFPLRNQNAMSAIRKLGVLILNLEVFLLYGQTMQDILSGMWITKKTAAQKLFLREGGWNLSPEIKLRALTHPQVSFSEYHIDHKYRTGGASKQQIWQTGFDHLVYIAVFKVELMLTTVQSFLKAPNRRSATTLSELFPATSLE